MRLLIDSAVPLLEDGAKRARDGWLGKLGVEEDDVRPANVKVFLFFSSAPRSKGPTAGDGGGSLLEKEGIEKCVLASLTPPIVGMPSKKAGPGFATIVKPVVKSGVPCRVWEVDT